VPASKIVDEQEVIRWFSEGRTYEWMSQQYREKYDTEMTLSAWGNFRRRRGLVRRITRDDELIPWAVREEHRFKYPLRMLRLEARIRVGESIREDDVPRHRNFMAHLRDANLVVQYDPDSEEGFHLVPREAGDTDVIRRPPVDLQTTRRRAD
jgi:hypothetical protein